MLEQILLQVQTKCLWEVKVLILPSLSKILGDLIDQFFFGHSFPAGCGLIVGVVIPQQVQGLFCRDPVLLHEVVDPQISFNFSGFGGPP